MWYMYTMEYYSAIKKSEIMAFAARRMDLEIIMLSEASQTVRHKHHTLPLHVESKNKDTMNLLAEQKLTHRL